MQILKLQAQKKVSHISHIYNLEYYTLQDKDLDYIFKDLETTEEARLRRQEQNLKKVCSICE